MCIPLFQVKGFQSILHYLYSFAHSHCDGGKLHCSWPGAEAGLPYPSEHYPQARQVKYLAQGHNGVDSSGNPPVTGPTSSYEPPLSRYRPDRGYFSTSVLLRCIQVLLVCCIINI